MKIDNFKSTPLIDSVLHNDFDLFKAQIAGGADVNATDYNNLTALYYASQDGRIEMARILIEKGAIIDVRDPYGNTPLTKAIQCSYNGTEMISLLIEKGADMDIDNNYGISPRKLALGCMNNEEILKAMKIETPTE